MMIEPEIAFAGLKEDMFVENMMKYLIRYIMENAPEEMEFLINLLTIHLLKG